MDATRIRLVEGSPACLYTVIVNLLRRGMAWRVHGSFIPGVTAEWLIEAARNTRDVKSQLVVDGGVEHVNSAVDNRIHSGLLKRILAQAEIRCSNSPINVVTRARAQMLQRLWWAVRS